MSNALYRVPRDKAVWHVNCQHSSYLSSSGRPSVYNLLQPTNSRISFPPLSLWTTRHDVAQQRRERGRFPTEAVTQQRTMKTRHITYFVASQGNIKYNTLRHDNSKQKKPLCSDMTINVSANRDWWLTSTVDVSRSLPSLPMHVTHVDMSDLHVDSIVHVIPKFSHFYVRQLCWSTS